MASVTATSPPRVQASSTPTYTPTCTATYTATAIPTPVVDTPASEGLIAFDSYACRPDTRSLGAQRPNGEIYLLDSRTGAIANLTRHPADDRTAAWRPDGGAIAFESHRDGNWEIYLLSLADGALTRLTDALAYDGAPAWSPDGSQIAFESYRDGNVEIYVLSVSDGSLRRLTEDPAGDYGPAWSLDGEMIAFTSWRDGNKEVYLVSAEGGEARNLTQNPADDEDPAWMPNGGSGEEVLAFVSWRDLDAGTLNRNAEIYLMDVAEGSVERLTDNVWPDLDPAWDAEGRLLWSAYDPGAEFETYDPFRPGYHHLYRQGPAGPERLTSAAGDDRRPAAAPLGAQHAAPLQDLIAVESEATQPASHEQATPSAPVETGALAQVVTVPSILANYSQAPIRVNEFVAPSLAAWQQDLQEASGWDFLGMTLGAWRSIDSVRKKEMYAYDYGFLSWHKAGRALDLALEYKVDGVDQIVLAREDLGQQVYWRMYLRTARQDGSQGEPLKDNPWLYWWHIVPDNEPEAYGSGGKRLPIPGGYYVDVTAMAKRHGWQRIASYAIEGDYHWHSDSNGTEYWHYERTDGLIWWDAMRQLYPPETLEEHVGWQAGLQHAQSEPMMRSKGVPEPAATRDSTASESGRVP
jgi:TolB protein